MKKIILCLIGFLSIQWAIANEIIPLKKVLIVCEGRNDAQSLATAEARQLQNLMGHFNTQVAVVGSDEYKTGGIAPYDVICYVGFTAGYEPSPLFMADVNASNKTLIWLCSGMDVFSKKFDTRTKLGFSVSGSARELGVDMVKHGSQSFTKRMPDLYKIEIADKKRVTEVATAFSSKSKRQTPYIIHAGSVWYVADLPFIFATETDRYLLFCDLLHDMLGEQHATSHRALLRIEDVTPVDNPDHLRDIADMLSERNIPFAVGFVPFYVNPATDVRISLSDRPEMVDALRYVVEKGGTIVMHGVTHQYRGASTDDYEFWDGSRSRPIPDEQPKDIASKLESGIYEFMKNGVYPLLWETPHYTASSMTYQTVTKYFSSAFEQRLSTNNADYSQYYPYIINKDMYGQRIYPENLGYIPLGKKDASEQQVQRILTGAKAMLNVRDGIASNFFHSFLDLDLLRQIVDGMQQMGYTYMDLRAESHWVKTNDKLITSGSMPYSLNLNNSYIQQLYLNKKGDITKKVVSDKRVNGKYTGTSQIPQGSIFVAEPVEHRAKELSWGEKFWNNITSNVNDLLTDDEHWHEARVALYWNPNAKGALLNDQASFASIFQSLNINVDTIMMGERLALESCNVLVVPYASADSLTDVQISRIHEFVENGGSIVTDYRNKLTKALGITFMKNEVKVQSIREKLFPQERVVWKYTQVIKKAVTTSDDKIYCVDAATETPLVFGRSHGKGQVLYFPTLFDAHSTGGYSSYPFGFEYIKNLCNVQPVVRYDNLEYYFDPGLRQNTSVENLVKLWVRHGVRYIHVAGWHQYPKYTYDYGRLIKLCHANGIKVYAWLEPPQVNQMFWKNHPEWREKNRLGLDVRASWRYPMAVSDPACFKAMMNEYVSFLRKYDFDGVNLAELYYESDKGMENPDSYMPAHPSFNNELKAKYGFTVAELFDPASRWYWKKNSAAAEAITELRVLKINQCHEQLLQVLTAEFTRKNPSYEIIVTTMDSHGSPELRTDIAVVTEQILALQKKYNFKIQIEDPQARWSDDPKRYEALGNYYASLVTDRSKLLLDLNIMQFRSTHELQPFPTLIQTGAEAYSLIRSSALGAPRNTIYGEGSVNPQDLALFPYAASANVVFKHTANGYEVSSPTSFQLRLPIENHIIKIDNQLIVGLRENSFFVPAGIHTVSFHNDDIPGFSTVEIQPQILSSTANITALSYNMRSISFDYNASETALVSISGPPSEISVDGKNYEFEALKGNDCYTVSLPAGNHSVAITIGTSLSYRINVTSLWSTNAIVIYGALSVIALIIMYLILKVIRRKYEK